MIFNRERMIELIHGSLLIIVDGTKKEWNYYLPVGGALASLDAGINYFDRFSSV